MAPREEGRVGDQFGTTGGQGQECFCGLPHLRFLQRHFYLHDRAVQQGDYLFSPLPMVL